MRPKTPPSARPRPCGAAPSRPRGRPREFDTDAAIDAAMHAFWARGYQRTSLPELIEETGLARGSIYKAFGDKRAVFLLATERYVAAWHLRARAAIDGAPTRRDAIRRLLHEHAARSTGEAGARGCLLVQAALEMVPHDAVIAARVTEAFVGMRRVLADAIAAAGAAGEIPCVADRDATAAFALAALEGLRVLGKTGVSAGAARSLADTVFDVICGGGAAPTGPAGLRASRKGTRARPGAPAAGPRRAGR